MKKNYIFGALAILFLSLVSAVVFTEPWSSNQDGGQNNLTNLDYFQADTINGTSIIGTLTGNASAMNWTGLYGYPTACPDGYYLTELGDSVTCTAVHGNINIQNLNATGSSTLKNISCDDGTCEVGSNLNLSNKELYLANMYFGNTSGTFNETCPNRPFTSNYARNITVDDSGGADYTTIQEAVCQVPFILRHEWNINVADGNYSEDVYIPATVISGLNDPATEGSFGLLKIEGNSKINTQVKSFQATSIIGTWGLILSKFNVYGIEPTSDENVSISIYGSTAVLLTKINFTSNVYSALMGYNSGLYIHSSNFSSSQTQAVNLKAGGFLKFGDLSENSFNSGSVSGYLIRNAEGVAYIDKNNAVTSLGITQCDHYFEIQGVTMFKNQIYCLTLNESNQSFYSDISYSSLGSYNFDSSNINSNYSFDSSGKNNHGVNTNLALSESGGFNNGGYVSFDRTNNVNLSYMLNTTNPFSINFWIKNNNKTVQSTILGKYATVTGQRDLLVLETPGGLVEIRASPNGENSGIVYLRGDLDISDNQWHFISITSNGTNVSLYQDGNYYNYSSISKINNGGQPLYLGQALGGNVGFQGSMDNLMIFNRTLTNNEVKSLYLTKYESSNSYVSQKDITIDSSGNANITDGNLTGKNIFPQTTSLYSIGSSLLRWLKGWFVDLDVSGTTQLNNTIINGTITVKGIAGFTGSGVTSCVVNNITNGIITGATCT